MLHSKCKSLFFFLFLIDYIYLFIYIFFPSRIPSDKAERSPLKLLHSPNFNIPAITVKASAKHRRSLTTNEEHLLHSGIEHFPGQMNGIVQENKQPAANGMRQNDKMEEGKIPTGYGSKFCCQWTVATTEDEKIHNERAEQNEEEKQKQEEREGDEANNKESTEQKLFNIATELLQTEKAYVTRLHLLDQVSVYAVGTSKRQICAQCLNGELLK